MVKRRKCSSHSPVRTPITPSDGESISDEEEKVEEEYQIINKDGKMVSSMFDHITSIGSVLALAEKSFGKAPVGHEYHIVIGGLRPRILSNMYAKLRDIFDGCSHVNQRQFMCVLFKRHQVNN